MPMFMKPLRVGNQEISIAKQNSVIDVIWVLLLDIQIRAFYQDS